MGDEFYGFFLAAYRLIESNLPSFRPSVCISFLAADLTGRVVYAFLKARSFFGYPQSVCDIRCRYPSFGVGEGGEGWNQ